MTRSTDSSGSVASSSKASEMTTRSLGGGGSRRSWALKSTKQTLARAPDTTLGTPPPGGRRRWRRPSRTPRSNPRRPLGVPQHDRLDDVRHVLAAVDRALQLLVDLLELDHLEDVAVLPLEEPLERQAEDVVALVLQAIDLHAEAREQRRVLQVAQPGHRLLHLDAGAGQHLGEQLGLVGRLLHPVDDQAAGRGIDVVDDVVQPRSQLVDVLALERRDEGQVQLV